MISTKKIKNFLRRKVLTPALVIASLGIPLLFPGKVKASEYSPIMPESTVTTISGAEEEKMKEEMRETALLKEHGIQNDFDVRNFFSEFYVYNGAEIRRWNDVSMLYRKTGDPALLLKSISQMTGAGTFKLDNGLMLDQKLIQDIVSTMKNDGKRKFFVPYLVYLAQNKSMDLENILSLVKSSKPEEKPVPFLGKFSDKSLVGLGIGLVDADTYTAVLGTKGIRNVFSFNPETGKLDLELTIAPESFEKTSLTSIVSQNSLKAETSKLSGKDKVVTKLNFSKTKQGNQMRLSNIFAFGNSPVYTNFAFSDGNLQDYSIQGKAFGLNYMLGSKMENDEGQRILQLKGPLKIGNDSYDLDFIMNGDARKYKLQGVMPFLKANYILADEYGKRTFDLNNIGTIKGFTGNIRLVDGELDSYRFRSSFKAGKIPINYALALPSMYSTPQLELEFTKILLFHDRLNLYATAILNNNGLQYYTLKANTKTDKLFFDAQINIDPKDPIKIKAGYKAEF